MQQIVVSGIEETSFSHNVETFCILSCKVHHREILLQVLEVDIEQKSNLDITFFFIYNQAKLKHFNEF